MGGSRPQGFPRAAVMLTTALCPGQPPVPQGLSPNDLQRHPPCVPRLSPQPQGSPVVQSKCAATPPTSLLGGPRWSPRVLACSRSPYPGGHTGRPVGSWEHLPSPAASLSSKVPPSSTRPGTTSASCPPHRRSTCSGLSDPSPPSSFPTSVHAQLVSCSDGR